MADRGGNVQTNTSIKPDLGATLIPHRRSKDGPSWWQKLVILLARDLGFFLVLAFWLHAPLVQKISNMEAKALDMEGELIELRSRTNIEAKALDMERELIELRSTTSTLSGRLESLDKYFGDNEWLSKEEFNRVFEDYNKKRKGGSDGNVDLNEVAVLARDIVTKEIEKHAADGVGRVDYALASAGAFVTKHSVKASDFANSVRMITPSFGQPGECFALKGNSGFVEIKLWGAIIPQAITLEHVAKSVVDNRWSAPKDCRVHGWFSRQNVTLDSREYFLGNFTYDLEKSSIQTFDVTDSSRVIDMIRLDFTSNHGNPSYTCIYRFRVHGYQPDKA